MTWGDMQDRRCNLTRAVRHLSHRSGDDFRLGEHVLGVRFENVGHGHLERGAAHLDQFGRYKPATGQKLPADP